MVKSEKHPNIQVKTMQYYVRTHKKLLFTVTPEELRLILEGFHHVITNTGVSRDYVESDPNDFFSKYDTLYQKLKTGEKIIWENDHKLATLTTGVTRHLENCRYEPSSKLSIPNFSEPCSDIITFCFFPFKDHLSTAFDPWRFPENICGLELLFPGKVEYSHPNDKNHEGFVSYTEFDDYETYETLLERIRAITKPLKLDFNGKIRKTTVRVSEKAKKDLENFYFINANNVKIL